MFEKLYALIYGNLIEQSPILSGNMQSFIQLGQIGINEVDIIIDAPGYDLKKWKKDKVVVHNGTPAYAYNVNKYGAFGSHNKSEHWVNRVLLECCEAIANEVGGVVINELPL